jgi:hypothetical protein
MPSVDYSCYIAEPPWRDNRRGVSCIPAGEYVVRPRQSPRYGLVFHVKNVEGRSWILHHSGNYAGDTEKGLKSHTMGCLLHGKAIGWLGEQLAVLNSRMAIREFQLKTDMQDFKMTVQWLFWKQ